MERRIKLTSLHIIMCIVMACFDQTHASCSQGALRLVGGSTQNQGRVEVCYNNAWGTVCDDNFGVSDAKVVCRQLGYCNTQNPVVRGSAYYGQGTGSIVLDDVNCNGNEATLLQCPRSQPILSHNCQHTEDVGVVCSVRGEKGQKGQKGEKGQRGGFGVQGPRGDRGSRGYKGAQGVKGDRGMIGPQGPTGLRGETGLKGDTGIKGDTGEKGVMGAKGDLGTKGEAGETGLPGTPANTTDLEIKQVQAIEASTRNTVQLAYASIILSLFATLIVFIHMCVLMRRLPIKMYKAVKDMVTVPPPIPPPFVPESADGKELDQSIELYNKLRGGYRTTGIPLQVNNCYETTASALRK